jgi:hypothetical protein
MEWETLEHLYAEKTNDWYASVILISGSLIALEFLMNNFLLITLTFVATVTFILLAARRPELIHVTITPSGIRAGNLLYTFTSLDGYAIAQYAHDTRLLLESNRHIMPLVVIPIPPEVDLDTLREELNQYLPEKELHESLPHLLLERLGF